MTKVILVTGATGKQGGAVIDAMLKEFKGDYIILAATRDWNPSRGEQLLRKSSSINTLKYFIDLLIMTSFALSALLLTSVKSASPYKSFQEIASRYLSCVNDFISLAPGHSE
jgi:hypothetical protein